MFRRLRIGATAGPNGVEHLPETSEFGMLAADAAFRGRGIGREPLA
jgi:ribosomal protein S18 acetylase RimI-like enzyme